MASVCKDTDRVGGGAYPVDGNNCYSLLLLLALTWMDPTLHREFGVRKETDEEYFASKVGMSACH